MDSTTNPAAASPVGSVDKALALVELLAEAGPAGLALRDVVEASGLNKPSAHRMLQALVHRGFAEQDAAQRYRFGSRPAVLVDTFLREERSNSCDHHGVVINDGQPQWTLEFGHG